MASQISYLKSHIQFKTYAIIVAGGSGTRMQAAIPKQFLLMSDLPVMMHTINAFEKNSYQAQIIIALQQAYHEHWAELCSQYDFNIPHQVVAGGDTRFQSVKNALKLIEDENSLVAIQDAVRPLTSTKIIDNAFVVAAEKGNAVVAVKSRDTVRQQKDGVSKHLNREEIYLVQTPQTFKTAILKKAYEQPYQSTFTDDASVVESIGEHINLIEGSYTNIKITYPEDIALAEILIKKAAY